MPLRILNLQLEAHTRHGAYPLERATELAGTQLVIHTPGDLATDVWRLRTALLPEAAARDLCGRLRAEGVDCVPVVD